MSSLKWRQRLTICCELIWTPAESIIHIPLFPTPAQLASKSGKPDLQDEYINTGIGQTTEMLLFGQHGASLWGWDTICDVLLKWAAPHPWSHPTPGKEEGVRGAGKKIQKSHLTTKTGECFAAGSLPWSKSPWSQMNMCQLEPRHDSVAKAKASTREEKVCLFGEQLGYIITITKLNHT